MKGRGLERCCARQDRSFAHTPIRAPPPLLGEPRIRRKHRDRQRCTVARQEVAVLYLYIRAPPCGWIQRVATHRAQPCPVPFSAFHHRQQTRVVALSMLQHQTLLWPSRADCGVLSAGRWLAQLKEKSARHVRGKKIAAGAVMFVCVVSPPDFSRRCMVVHGRESNRNSRIPAEALVAGRRRAHRRPHGVASLTAPLARTRSPGARGRTGASHSS